jgi:hypothetical protein
VTIEAWFSDDAEILKELIAYSYICSRKNRRNSRYFFPQINRDTPPISLPFVFAQAVRKGKIGIYGSPLSAYLAVITLDILDE